MSDDFMKQLAEHLTEGIENPGEVSSRVGGYTVSLTDWCDCDVDWANDPEYPACPHDLRGPKGAPGGTDV